MAKKFVVPRYDRGAAAVPAATAKTAYVFCSRKSVHVIVDGRADLADVLVYAPGVSGRVGMGVWYIPVRWADLLVQELTDRGLAVKPAPEDLANKVLDAIRAVK